MTLKFFRRFGYVWMAAGLSMLWAIAHAEHLDGPSKAVAALVPIVWFICGLNLAWEFRK